MVEAISQDSRLRLLFDENDRPVNVQSGGVVISEHLAKILGVTRGSRLGVKVEYPKTKESEIVVTDVISQYLGNTIYMSYQEAERISDYGKTFTAVLVKGDGSVEEALMGDWQNATLISSIQSRQEKLAMYRRTVSNVNQMMASMTLLGLIIGVAVIYVSSLISFEELKREIAVMMTLGLKSKECLDVVSVGQVILSVFGILLGIPLAMAASRLIADSIASRMLTVPSFVNREALVRAAGLIAVSVGISGQIMLRKIKKLAPVDLLRERE